MTSLLAVQMCYLCISSISCIYADYHTNLPVVFMTPSKLRREVYNLVLSIIDLKKNTCAQGGVITDSTWNYDRWVVPILVWKSRKYPVLFRWSDRWNVDWFLPMPFGTDAMDIVCMCVCLFSLNVPFFLSTCPVNIAFFFIFLIV